MCYHVKPRFATAFVQMSYAGEMGKTILHRGSISCANMQPGSEQQALQPWTQAAIRPVSFTVHARLTSGVFSITNLHSGGLYTL